MQYFMLQRDLRKLIKKPNWRDDRKLQIDYITKYNNQNVRDYAQNVLTYCLGIGFHADHLNEIEKNFLNKQLKGILYCIEKEDVLNERV